MFNYFHIYVNAFYQSSVSLPSTPVYHSLSCPSQVNRVMRAIKPQNCCVCLGAREKKREYQSDRQQYSGEYQ